MACGQVTGSFCGTAVFPGLGLGLGLGLNTSVSITVRQAAYRTQQEPRFGCLAALKVKAFTPTWRFVRLVHLRGCVISIVHIMLVSLVLV